MFRGLENKYGDKSSIVKELEKINSVRGNQPRRVTKLIQTVEKALADLTELGYSGAIKKKKPTGDQNNGKYLILLKETGGSSC